MAYFENSPIILIAAVGIKNEDGRYPIGKNGTMPWKCSEDLKWFKQVTEGGVVIMGRRTYEAIGGLLDNRINIIISGSGNAPNGAILASDTNDAVNKAKSYGKPIFVIGGGSVYSEFLNMDIVDTILVDYLPFSVDDADTFLEIPCGEGWTETCKKQIGGGCVVSSISRKRGNGNNADSEYIKFLENILENGTLKKTRCGDCISVFGSQMRFSLSEGIPVLTTKKMFTSGCIRELLWFLDGATNIKPLVENGVHIWDGDAYRFYKEIIERNNSLIKNKMRINYIVRSKHDVLPFDDFIKCVIEGKKIHIVTCDGFHVSGAIPNECERDYTFGDLGNVYGAQWRSWSGHDQIMEVMNELRNNPESRRMLVSAWNVGDLPGMALPPCHHSFQLYVREASLQERMNYALKRMPNVYSASMTDDTANSSNVPKMVLSLLWNQRSCDAPLGVPFNIMSYSILCELFAKCSNMIPGDVIFSGGDCHIYTNQIEKVREQIANNPHKFGLPELILNDSVTEITDFKYEDISINGYFSYPSIKFPLSVGL